MAGADELNRDLGKLEGRVSAIEALVAEVRADVKKILEYLNSQKGGLRAIAILAAAAGAVGGGVLTLALKAAPFIPFR